MQAYRLCYSARIMLNPLCRLAWQEQQLQASSFPVPMRDEGSCACRPSWPARSSSCRPRHGRCTRCRPL